MDHRFELIKSQLQLCLRQSEVFAPSSDRPNLFESAICKKGNVNWLVAAAGVSESEADEFIADGDEERKRFATTPLQVLPVGQASLLLVLRPCDGSLATESGKFATEFTRDIGSVEMFKAYFRIDGLESPAIQQVRWELDPVQGYLQPQESWLRPWANEIGCNPAHAPSHWHINSPPREVGGPRQRRSTVVPPELRLATGLPNPLLLILSLASWLRQP